MIMYEVHIHGYGRPIVKHGPAQGLPDWPRHEWIRISERPIGIVKARQMADDQTCHAVVVVRHTSGKVYDNRKEPYLPEGWIKAD